MSSPQRVSPRVARRRALLLDVTCAALLAGVAMALAAGVGIVAVGALIALLAMLAWTGVESALARTRRRATRR